MNKLLITLNIAIALYYAYTVAVERIHYNHQAGAIQIEVSKNPSQPPHSTGAWMWNHHSPLDEPARKTR